MESVPSSSSPTVANQPLPVQGNTALYVGDLDHSVTEAQLHDIFSQVAPVLSVRVCRDHHTRDSLGYAYVNFNNAQDASNAKDTLNYIPVNGKPMRVMFSNRDSSIRKCGHGNVFIRNLDISSIDNQALQDIFASFGTVLSCKLAVDGNGQSKGYGFVHFEKEEAANNAIKELNGMLINDKPVYVGLFVSRQERERANEPPNFTNVYVKNLSKTTTHQDLNRVFGDYGTITSAVVMRDADGNSRCFGFVNFRNPGDASAAIENLNGRTFDDKVWYVGKALRKAEREQEINRRLQGTNLFIKNIDDSIDDNKLKELFAEFGMITSCKIMLDSKGWSKGFGFVEFSTLEEATRAINEMNGKMMGNKPLYVAVAQRKEERRAMLQAEFAQITAPGAMAPALPSSLPGTVHTQFAQPRAPGAMAPARPSSLPGTFHPPAPRLALYQIPPRPAGYGFQQPAFAPNFFGASYPLQEQGQPRQWMAVRGFGVPEHMQQQQVSEYNANQGFGYIQNAPMGVGPSFMPQGMMGPMMPLPLDGFGMPMAPPMINAPRPEPISVSELASALAYASPEDQRLMLGEHLFPLVECLEYRHAGKITGMVLEMEQAEVLHLIESPDDLKRIVGEAMNVLRFSQTRDSDAAD